MTLHLRNSLYLLLLLFIPGVLTAQSSVGFSVSPTILDMTAVQEQTWETSIRIINPNQYPLDLYVEVANFVPMEESGVPEFIPLSSTDNLQNLTLAEWMNVPEKVTVEAQKTIELPIKITVPESADPGGYFAAVLVGTKPPSGEGKTAVATSQIISSLLFLQVGGEITEVAAIRSFRTTDYILSRPEATFELRVQNDGNVHLQPQGRITIYNMWGQVRGEIDVNQGSLFGKVLPSSIRKYSFDWNSDWSIADIGKYKAKVALSYGNTARQSMTAETSFWVIPWNWVLLTLLIVGLFVYGFIVAIKMYIRRTLQLSGFSTLSSYQESTTLTPKAKRLNIVAPFEAGMLDLREELTEAPDWSEKIKAVVKLCVKYKKFTFFILGLLLFIWTVSWYAGQGLEERGFTITSENGVAADSNGTNSQSEVQEAGPLVKVVNRTGDPAAVQFVTEQIEVLGYKVEETTTEAVEDRTVIVFSPSRTDEALRLSSLLQNAPLSALPEATEVNPELTIFLGSDVLR